MLSFSFLSYHMFFLKKTKASSVVIAYVGRFNPGFDEFRAFKVPYPLVLPHSLRLMMFIFCSFLFSECGHYRICINITRKHHDNQHFGVVFVSSLQPTTGS